MGWPESICATINVNSQPWSPSIQISASMQVIQKIVTRRDTEFNLSYDEKRRVGSDGKKKDVWCARFKFDVKNSLMPKHCIAWADTAPPLAICLAALKAVGDKDKE